MFLLAGCGDRSVTSTGTGVSLSRAEIIELDSGAVIHITYTKTGQQGEPQAFVFQLRAEGAQPGATTGTVHWGDFTDTRIRDDHNVTVYHTYHSAGEYRIAVELDGQEKVVVATVSILAAANSSVSAATQYGTIQATGIFAGTVCQATATANGAAFADFSATSPQGSNVLGNLSTNLCKHNSPLSPGSLSSSSFARPGQTPVTFLSPLVPMLCAAGDEAYVKFESTEMARPGVLECRWEVI